MGKRDRFTKESKKPKKDAKKIVPVSIMAPPPEVQVIKKGKQREGRRAEEAEE
jgi:hypothetical protein